MRPPGFSSHHRHGKLLAERIQVRILGQTGRILGSYLHDLFQSSNSSFVAMTQLKNLAIVSALFDSFNTENLRVVQFLTNMNSLPMGETS
jgi:hypothetical protein